MQTITIKNITEHQEQINDNTSQNVYSITFEVDADEKKHLETITLKGNGALKSPAIV